MTNIEWLNMKKKVCEHGIEIYYDKIKEFERELEAIKSLISLAEGQPADSGTAHCPFTAVKDRIVFPL